MVSKSDEELKKGDSQERKLMPSISIITPCYNEEENAKAVYSQVRDVFRELKEYAYEHIFIDNCQAGHPEGVVTQLWCFRLNPPT